MQLHWPPESSAACPHQLLVRSPGASVSVEKPQQVLGRWSEDLVAELYERSGWQVAHKRFRIRGSEVDLVVINAKTHAARIIEVKARRSQGQLTLADFEGLISHKKLASLRHGAQFLASLYQAKGLDYRWSFDFVVVIPDFKEGRHLVTTWPNSLDMSH